VRDRNGPEAGDLGPKGSSGKQERDPFSEIATRKQGDRRDPVTVIINGEPVAKGRPRMTRRGFVYTPAATRKFEAHGRLSAQLAMDGRPPIEAPVRIELLIELPMPASWSKRKTADAITGHIRPTSRPDVDKKAFLDAISTIVVADDAQVVEVYVVGGHAREHRYTEDQKVIWHRMLIGEALRRGKNPNWAFYLFRDKFGHDRPADWDRTALEPSPEVSGFVKSRIIAFAKRKQREAVA